MTQPPHEQEQDVQRRIKAETSLAHLRDQEKQILAREVEASKLLEPIKRRKAENHFLDEAMQLLNRRRGT